MKHDVRSMLSALAVTAFVVATGTASAAQPATTGHAGVPQDWSSRLVIYHHPLTPVEAAQQGKMQKWLHDAQDPRFIVALAHRLNKMAPLPSSSPGAPFGPSTMVRSPSNPKIKPDWSASLGSIGGSGTPDVYPAKYSFDINAAPSCANDYVVYTTANPGTRSQWTGTFTGNGGTGKTLTVNGTTLTADTAFSTSISSIDFLVSNNTTTEAASLASGVNGQVSATGVSASSSAGVVTFTYPSGTVPTAPTEALNNYTQSTVTTTTHTDATLVGYNNLYKTTCSGTVPGVFFAYNTGVGATTRTSPVISYSDNGKQIAFIQSNSSSQAQLVLLKWSSASPGTPTTPTTPSTVTAANYRTCTAPCMAVFTFNGNADDLHSSPFVDYFHDTLWVGDTAGKLHKFTGVFVGTPAEVVTGGFPATVSAGNELSPPVVDINAQQAYVGSAFSGTTGGTFARVDGSSGTVSNSGVLTTVTTASTGVLASPMLDSSQARVYAFLFSDGSAGTGATGNNCTTLTGNPDGCRSIIQFTTGFAAGNTGNTKQWVGRGNNSPVLVFNEGTFDDAYYSSSNGTGSFYICGGEPSNTYYATMWKVPVTANVLGTPVQGAEVGYHDNSTGRTGDCSTVTEVKNGANEYLFLSVTGHGFQTTTNCSGDDPGGGCVYMFNLANLGSGSTTWATTNVAQAGFAVPGGTGGIIVDNVSSSTGASQIYFSGLAAIPGASGTFTNAYQASQSALQ